MHSQAVPGNEGRDCFVAILLAMAGKDCLLLVPRLRLGIHTQRLCLTHQKLTFNGTYFSGYCRENKKPVTLFSILIPHIMRWPKLKPTPK